MHSPRLACQGIFKVSPGYFRLLLSHGQIPISPIYPILTVITQVNFTLLTACQRFSSDAFFVHCLHRL